VEPGELLFGVATDPGQVSDALSGRYRVEIEPPTAARWTCLDTADWRLHKNGMTLRDARRGRHGTLLLSYGNPEPMTAPAPPRRWPRGIETLPDSPVRDRIAPAVGVRALLPLAEVDVRTLRLRVLDDELKTRVRVEVDQQRLIGPVRSRQAPLPLRVVVSALRGYERDGQRCTELLAESMGPLTEFGTSAAAAFTAAGHRPGQPTVSPVHLDPHAPVAESMAGVLRRWIDIIDAVRPGVLADIDVEYLHEMRTSVRATRSLLRLGAALMPDAQTARFTEDFAWLGRLTAPLRDLDVYLIELSGRGETDLTQLEDLEPLRRHLARQRQRALATLRAGLESPRGRSLSTQWRTALDQLAAPEPPGPDTRSVAAELARTAYRRIVKTARPVHSDTHPDELHRLRRFCKRMRYLLDGYASVYSPEAHRQVLSALKGLQDCLGEIQDVDVQRRELAGVATTLARRGVATETLLAMGALRDRSLQRDAAARRTLTRRLERFCGPETRTRVAALGTADS
jgi:CHAD domain-containing protein